MPAQPARPNSRFLKTILPNGMKWLHLIEQILIEAFLTHPLERRLKYQALFAETHESRGLQRYLRY